MFTLLIFFHLIAYVNLIANKQDEAFMNKSISAAFALFLAFVSFGAVARTGLIYQISLNGVVNTYTLFSRTGYLVLTPTVTNITKNGLNPIDLALVSGNPVAAPSPGSIQYFTNYALYTLVGGIGTSQLDLAYVSMSGSCIIINPHTDFLMGLHKSNPSVFTARYGIAAQLYYTLAGSMSVCSSDGWKTVTGKIDYLGSSFFSSPYPSMPYKASFIGKYIGSGSI